MVGNPVGSAAGVADASVEAACGSGAVAEDASAAGAAGVVSEAGVKGTTFSGAEVAATVDVSEVVCVVSSSGMVLCCWWFTNGSNRW